jgi:hypothetical protein
MSAVSPAGSLRGWRASFGLQVLVVAVIAWLALGIVEPARVGPRPRFDLTGAVLSAIGLFFVVLGLASPTWDPRRAPRWSARSSRSLFLASLPGQPSQRTWTRQRSGDRCRAARAGEQVLTVALRRRAGGTATAASPRTVPARPVRLRFGRTRRPAAGPRDASRVPPGPASSAGSALARVRRRS